jgi:hypothetical protein
MWTNLIKSSLGKSQVGYDSFLSQLKGKKISVWYESASLGSIIDNIEYSL